MSATDKSASLSTEKTYIVACKASAFLGHFVRARGSLPGAWFCISHPSDLTLDLLDRLKPRYVFFPHWSWIVPPQIVERYECVCFHMTDLPFGRGGSPLQNLIQRGIGETKITALRMTDEVDAGPIYEKRALSLAGSAQEIFDRAYELICAMIQSLAANEPIAKAQEGQATLFRRRRPEESRVPADAPDLHRLYDHIRMLDADGYPRAFLDHGPWRLEFASAQLAGDAVSAAVRFFPKPGGKEGTS